MTVVVVMSSLFRDANITALSILSAASCGAIDRVVVHGYTPVKHGKVTPKPIPASPVHAAYRWIPDEDVPTHVLALGDKNHVVDPLPRTRWRSQLVLDAWYVLKTDAEGVVVWLENDGIVDCDRFRRTLASFEASGDSGASCYAPDGPAAVYRGSGAVCIMLSGRHVQEVRRHLLAYHMVQPLDWILSDYSRGRWRVYDAVAHGRAGSRHASTRVV